MVMEKNKFMDPAKQNCPEEIPALLQFISSNEVEGFDSVSGNENLNYQIQSTVKKPLNSPPMVSIHSILRHLENRLAQVQLES